MGDDDRATIQLLRRLLLAAGALSIALAVALAVVADAGRSSPAGDDATGAPFGSASPTDRDARQSALVAASPGTMDSFPDADVGRVMLPDLEGRPFQGAPLTTNAFGMRERPYALAKPAGTVRVVLLGDSYVFGWGVPADERVGVHLERLLTEHAGADAPIIEVLHLAIPSWNILAECAYLRRQLHLMRPDLVVQVLDPNDLDDVAAVRGFGEMASFSSRFRERGDALVFLGHPPYQLGTHRQSLLAAGLDHLSRERYAEAAAALNALAADVELTGGRYVLLPAFGARLPLAARHLAADLAEEQLAWLPADFSKPAERRVSATDGHWSASAHAEVGALLYGLTVQRDLLPMLDLPPAPTATTAVAELHEVGRAQAARRVDPERLVQGWTIASDIAFPEPDADRAGQIHGGIDARGRIGPYAALVLANDSAASLRVRGRAPGSPVLVGTTLRIEVDGLPVHEHVVGAADEPLDVVLPLPDAIRDRPYLTVSFVADDYVYAEEDPRHLVAWQLDAVALVP